MLVTVFQDSIDQLSVLEQTIPAINKPSATSDVSSPLESAMLLTCCVSVSL